MSYQFDRPIVCVGEAAWDLHASAGALFDSARSFELSPGGGAINTVVELSRLGVRAALCAAFGDDPLGRNLKDSLESAGVDVRFVRLLAVRTGLVFMGRGLGGGRSYVSYR